MFHDGDGVSSYFVPHNQALERDVAYLRHRLQQTSRQSHEIQRNRQQLQQKALQQLVKYTNRRNDSIVNRAHCEMAYASLVGLLKVLQ